MRTRPFSELAAKLPDTPERRMRTAQRKRAIETAMALGRLREECHATQKDVAAAMNVSQPNVSRIEHEEDIYLSTLRDYIEALGGELEINAVFPDRKVRLEPAG